MKNYNNRFTFNLTIISLSTLDTSVSRTVLTTWPATW